MMSIYGASNPDDFLSSLVEMHTCFYPDSDNKHACIHLPVSPSCNLHCNFCRRNLDKNKKSVNMRRLLLSPEEAVSVLERAREIYPNIGVARISGPGDCLASAHALETFDLIHTRYPQMINCLSSNGLLLEENAARVVSSGIKIVTVMINAIEVNVLQELCSHIVYHDQQMTGATAARWLLLSQLKGIDKLSSLGIMVKINTVLIPGVNEAQIGKIARITAGLGAAMISIIPLIPQTNSRKYREPSYAELQAARKAAGEHLPVLKHCEHCQAEACGVVSSGHSLMREINSKSWSVYSH